MSKKPFKIRSAFKRKGSKFFLEELTSLGEILPEIRLTVDPFKENLIFQGGKFTGISKLVSLCRNGRKKQIKKKKKKKKKQRKTTKPYTNDTELTYTLGDLSFKQHGRFQTLSTIKFLSIWTARSVQTVQTHIRLLLKEQSDQCLHCLPFHLHLFDSLL